MSSNENDVKVNEAIMDMLRRGHPHRGKKMATSEVAMRPRKEDPPPGYRKADEELSAPPNYDNKGKAPVTAEPPKVAPLFFIPTKKIKPSPVHAAYQKMMAGLEQKVKTEQEAEQGAKLTDYDIAHRADALFVAKNLKLRYFHECSEEHFNEFKRLVAEGMSIDEACAAHSDFSAWMAVESQSQIQGGSRD